MAMLALFHTAPASSLAADLMAWTYTPPSCASAASPRFSTALEACAAVGPLIIDCANSFPPFNFVRRYVSASASGAACTIFYTGTTTTNGTTDNYSAVYGVVQQAADPLQLNDEAGGMCMDGKRVGNPIIPATGEKVLSQLDYQGAGGHAIDLVREYRSAWALGNAGRGLAVDSGLSRAWAHNHVVSVKREGTPGTTGSTATVITSTWEQKFSWLASGGTWVPLGSADTLSANATGLLYTRKTDDSLWQFDTAGKLLTATLRNGWVTTYTYSGTGTPSAVAPVPGLLTTVGNQFGRKLNFRYNSASQLVSVTAGDGQFTRYTYDGTGLASRLTAVSYPGNPGGAVSKAYLYENAAFPQLLTGIIDEKGSRLATYAYDTQGRGISTQHAGGADLHTISYGTGGAATVTDPLGTQRTYNYGTAKNKLAVTGADKPSGTGAGSASGRVQDANGFVTQETDFLGVNTMYTWDISRRLPLTATRAASLPEAQTTSTQWHASFRLPVLVTEAGRTTAYAYDGAGNPLSRTVTDTATSVARTTTWTYNAQGLLASETAPAGAVTRTSTYYSNTSANFSAPPPASPDPGFESVSLLLHGDGANGTTSFIESSAVPKALAAGGNAGISTAQSRFGGSSILFDGVRDYVFLPADLALAMKSSDFTIEMWVHKLGNNANFSRLWNVDGDMYADVNLSIDPSGKLVSYGSSNGSSWNAWAFATGVAVPDGAWKHIALVRLGGTVTLYVDGSGTVLTTALGTAALHDGGYAHVIGGQSTGVDRAFNGYIDEVRITKGVARYAANFTPPAQAFLGGAPALDPNETGHTAGDLQSVTNAAGHVTQFTQYDRAGRVRQMVDPNGIVTDTAYTPRGWVGSVTVTPPGGTTRTTSYSYDNAGLLTGVTLPDSTALGYSYDAAHRLTGVTDAKGNTVSYTLDNAGNKTGEQVKDPSGNLQRNITRVYDALNRVQQVTGASN